MWLGGDCRPLQAGRRAGSPRWRAGAHQAPPLQPRTVIGSTDAGQCHLCLQVDRVQASHYWPRHVVVVLGVDLILDGPRCPTWSVRSPMRRGTWLPRHVLGRTRCLVPLACPLTRLRATPAPSRSAPKEPTVNPLKRHRFPWSDRSLSVLTQGGRISDNGPVTRTRRLGTSGGQPCRNWSTGFCQWDGGKLPSGPMRNVSLSIESTRTALA